VSWIRTPTILRGGTKVNVIPGRASVDIDGRTLPGQTEADFLAELRHALGDGGDAAGADADRPTLEVLRSLPPVEGKGEGPLYDHLANTLKRNDPEGFPLPYLVPGFTDAKAYTRLGTTCFGFAPVRLDPTHEISFAAMYHGHDERVPVEVLAGERGGLRILYEAVAGWTGAS
jgi:acetylornithine deacetylase/succinyl-diaminopimelate desuccinylase-like protein